MTGGQNFRKWGNPEVHSSAYPVEVFDNVLRAQVARLCRRLDEADGAGLVATQVGLPQRVFAFRLSPVDEIDVLVTPRIAAPSDELATFVEGCLSFNAVAVEVQRPAGVGVVARDVHGRRRGLESDGFAASLVQRVIDHLDGVLTLDRADRAERPSSDHTSPGTRRVRCSARCLTRPGRDQGGGLIGR